MKPLKSITMTKPFTCTQRTHIEFITLQDTLYEIIYGRREPSIKYVRKNLPIFDPPSPLLPPPPPCTQCVRIGLDPPLSPLYARTQFSWIYRKYNTELVNRFFYANMFIFNYNMIFIKYKYICWIFKKKCVRTQQLWPPLPPCTQCVRIGLDPPSPSVRTYFMDDP